MNSLDDFWRAMFGQSISPFEEILMLNGTKVLAPEEPLFAIFAMMVRVVHEGQGKSEKALLKFAPELVSRAHAIINASNGIERELALLQHRADEFSKVLDRLARQSRQVALPHERQADLPQWVRRNLGPVATTMLTFFFCFGFVLASYVYR